MRHILGGGIGLITITKEEVSDLAVPDDCLLAPFGFSDYPCRPLENRDTGSVLCFIEFFQELAEKHDVKALQAIPAMCVVGEEDRARPAKSRVFRFKSLWPNGPVVTLPGVGHFLQEDAPESVAALGEQFIQMNNPPVVAFSEPSRAWNESNRWAVAKA